VTAAPAPDRPLEARGARYIAEIDGLRAIAVLAVLAYHLRPGYLPGGFAGVDLFFAISGFVVTGSMQGRDFTGLRDMLAYFYRRRLARIVPALVVMLPFAAIGMVLFATQQNLVQQAGRTGLWAALGLSNLYLFANDGSYFDPQQELNPFLHTWTLGVEEQFYLAFPLILLLCASRPSSRARRRAGLLLLAGLVVASLGFAFWCQRHAPQAGFYLLPARFWELGAGMLLLLARPSWQDRVRRLPAAFALFLFAAGSAAIAAGLMARFPDTAALTRSVLVVAGGLLVIALVSARPGGEARRALANPLAIYVGRISYSLYLWHWPIIALLHWTIGIAADEMALAAALASLLAASLSYHAIERPFRSWGKTAPRAGPVIAAGLAAMLAAAALLFLFFRAWPTLSLSTFHDTRTIGFTPSARACRIQTERSAAVGGNLLRLLPGCPDQRRQPGRLFVVGDSHAQMLDPMLRHFAAETGFEIWRYSRSRCEYPPLIDELAAMPACRRFYEGLTRELAARLAPTDILLMTSSRIRPAEARPPAAPCRERALDYSFGTLARLERSGARLIIDAPRPYLGSPPIRCLDWFNRANPICRRGLHGDRADLLRQAEPVHHAIARIRAAHPRLELWDTFDTLCPGSSCRGLAGGRALYTDRSHLSPTGLVLIYPGFRSLILAPRRADGPRGN
jgi:peptidoglycan/LPS O-acetylase OafA/YrhL